MRHEEQTCLSFLWQTSLKKAIKKTTVFTKNLGIGNMAEKDEKSRMQKEENLKIPRK